MNRKLNITKIIFFIYCIFLIWLILFKMAFSFGDIQLFEGNRVINIVPFRYLTDVGSIHTKEVLMNIIVFIPMGIYLKMLTILSRNIILVGFLSSFTFEVCQFIFALGASDITDIITNTIGTILGVCIYSVFLKFFKNNQKLDKIINSIALILLLLIVGLIILLMIAN